MKNLVTDVLVIGGGLAAACAAIESAKYGITVTLVDKGRLGSSGSTPTSGGNPQVFFPAELGGHPKDSAEQMLKDIVEGGEFLNDQEAAEIVVDESAQRVLEAAAFGVPYLKTPEGKFESYITLGMKFPRMGPVDQHGAGLMQALRKEVLHRYVSVVERVMITSLLTDNDHIVGAFGVDTKSGEFFIFEAKSVVLAAGGATGMYLNRSANYSTTGDSYALAFQLGIPLMNMEFTEFTVIPTPRGIPFSTGGIKPTLAAGAKFFNAVGERFLKKYDPERMEQTTRSLLVNAIHMEIAAGRGPCLLDATMIKETTRTLERVGEALGVDHKKERIPCEPAIHSNLGGVVIDHECRTEVDGLFGAGEAAGHAGAFGADRASGAIAACHVHGHRAGKYAALEALRKDVKSPPAKQVQEEKKKLEKLGREGGESPLIIERQLQNICKDSMGVKRSESGLREGLERLEKLAETPMNVSFPTDLIKALEVKNLILTAQIIGQSALERRESRGQHQREDYPTQDNASWLKWITLRKTMEAVSVNTRQVPIEKYSLQPSGGE